MKSIRSTYSDMCRSLHKSFSDFVAKNGNVLLLLFGTTLLIAGVSGLSFAEGSNTEAAYNDILVRNAVANLFSMIEGAFGALIMVVAGLGAIVAAAMGAYRLAVSMLVVAVGAFILRALVSLFFGENYANRGVGEI